MALAVSIKAISSLASAKFRWLLVNTVHKSPVGFLDDQYCNSD